MKRQESMSVGIVLARRRVGHKWQEHAWHLAELVPGAPEIGDWRLLREDETEAVYLAARLTIDLYPGETTDYRHNLSQRQPVVFVVLRRDEANSERPVRPFHATVCPAEAQDYLDGDELVETVPMPDVVAAWLRDYVDRFHVERKFEKRGRQEREARRNVEGRARG